MPIFTIAKNLKKLTNFFKFHADYKSHRSAGDTVQNNLTFYFSVFLNDPGRFEYTVPVPHSSPAKIDCSVRNPSETNIAWFKMKGRKHMMVPVASGHDNPFIKKFKNLKKSATYICNVSNSVGYKTRKFKIAVFRKYRRSGFICIMNFLKRLTFTPILWAVKLLSLIDACLWLPNTQSYIVVFTLQALA